LENLNLKLKNLPLRLNKDSENIKMPLKKVITQENITIEPSNEIKKRTTRDHFKEIELDKQM